MKMPSRPWYPPMQPRPDIFGLHHVTLLHAACESDAERQQRFAKVEAGMIAALEAAVHHLGEDAARELFNRVLRRPKRGRGKALAADRDYLLLKAYDAASPEGESVASIARRLCAKGTQLGNTAAAIAIQIRKLVAARKERERRARVEARRWRMATRNEPPTLAAGGLTARSSREK
jgi:hypothetical protein